MMVFGQHLSIAPVSTFKDNYVWIIINHPQSSAIVIDPGDAKPVAAFLEQHKLSLSAILITHHHWDHCNGIVDLIAQYPAPVYGPANEAILGVTNIVHEHDEITLPHFPFTLRVLSIP